MRMSTGKALAITLLLLILQQTTAVAQDTLEVKWETLEVHIGAWLAPSISEPIGLGTGMTDGGPSGWTARFSLAHGFNHLISLTLGTTLYRIVTSTSWWGGLGDQENLLVGVILGVRLYFPNIVPDAPIRPYLSAGCGPVFAFQARQHPSIEDPYSITAFGGCLGLGLDYLIGNRLKVGLAAEYNPISKFRRNIAGRERFEPVNITMYLGYMWSM
jgi:hypothetical protein